MSEQKQNSTPAAVKCAGITRDMVEQLLDARNGAALMLKPHEETDPWIGGFIAGLEKAVEIIGYWYLCDGGPAEFDDPVDELYPACRGIRARS